MIDFCRPSEMIKKLLTNYNKQEPPLPGEKSRSTSFTVSSKRLITSSPITESKYNERVSGEPFTVPLWRFCAIFPPSTNVRTFLLTYRLTRDEFPIQMAV